MACCDVWDAAFEIGTDNEGYGRLIRPEGDRWIIGSELAPLNYCPWCGVDKREPTPLEAKARRVVETMPMKLPVHYSEFILAVGILGDELDKLKG